MKFELFQFGVTARKLSTIGGDSSSKCCSGPKIDKPSSSPLEIRCNSSHEYEDHPSHLCGSKFTGSSDSLLHLAVINIVM